MPSNNAMPLDCITLQKPLRKLRKTLKTAPRRPSPELVHDLRTRMRRIEAEFRALLLDSRRNERKLLKTLKPIRRTAGKVRDMDVLMGFGYKLRVTGDEQCLVELLEYLGAERYGQAKKLRKITRQNGPAAISRLKRSTKYIGKVFDNSDKQSGKENLWPVDAMSTALQLGKELSRWPRLHTGNLHPFRLKVKQLRYTLELADKPKSDFIEALGEVKDAIGEWHDWEQLGAIASKVIDHGSGCNLMSAIRSKAKEKLDHGLSVANEMRQKYLQQPGGTRHRTSRRRLTLVPKKAVVEAATSLAA